MGNVSRDTEILRRNQKKMLEIKIALTEMKNTSDGLIRLNNDLGIGKHFLGHKKHKQ